VVASGPMAGRGLAWLVGSFILGAVLLAEHLYVAPGGGLRRDRLTIAFFNYNAFASVAFAACALLDLWLA